MRIKRRAFLTAGVFGAFGAACCLPWWNEAVSILEAPRRILPDDIAMDIHPRAKEAVKSFLEVDGDASVSGLLHWLRVFGVSADVDSDGERLNQRAKEIVDMLTDEKRIAKKYGQEGTVVETESGVKYLSRQSNLRLEWRSRAAHPGQVAAVFGEIGLRSSRLVRCNSKIFTIADVVRDCLLNLQCRDARRLEPEWAGLVYAHYANFSTWTNRFGESISINGLIDYLLKRPVMAYCCGGTHLLHTLAAILQADMQSELLQGATREKIEQKCLEYREVLERTQHANGAWLDDWAGHVETKNKSAVGVHMTGHILEGQLYLPTSLRISEKCIHDGVKFLEQEFLTVKSDDLVGNYCPYSHAGRVLMCCE